MSTVHTGFLGCRRTHSILVQSAYRKQGVHGLHVCISVAHTKRPTNVLLIQLPAVSCKAVSRLYPLVPLPF